MSYRLFTSGRCNAISLDHVLDDHHGRSEKTDAHLRDGLGCVVHGLRAAITRTKAPRNTRGSTFQDARPPRSPPEQGRRDHMVARFPSNARLNVGVVGATGLVGSMMRELLVEREFPVATLRLFASSSLAGTPMSWKGTTIE